MREHRNPLHQWFFQTGVLPHLILKSPAWFPLRGGMGGGISETHCYDRVISGHILGVGELTTACPSIREGGGNPADPSAGLPICWKCKRKPNCDLLLRL